MLSGIARRFRTITVIIEGKHIDQMLKRLTEMLSRGQNDRITKHTSNLVTGVEKSDGTSMNFKAKKSFAGFFCGKASTDYGK